MAIKFTEEQRLQAVKLYQAGSSIIKVSQLTGISASYIKNLLKKYNIQTRVSGFQKGNPIRTGLTHSSFSKKKISDKHKLSGHKPSHEAMVIGQPLTLKIRWKSHIKDPTAQLIKSYKNGAIKRKLDFFLTRKEFESFIYQDCFYCGAQPSLRKVNGCDLVCNGIDRLNSALGYTTTNCISACKICNIMKSTMSEKEFTEHCCKVAARFISGLVRFVDEY